MEDLKAQFDTVLKNIREGVYKKEPTQTQKLQLYAWYKQAIDGDVQGQAPGGFDIVAKAKYAAWARVKGMSREDAMKNYIEFFEQG